MLTLPDCRHCIAEQPKFWLQDLFDANQLQSQLDEQASMFINRQVQMLPCPCACMHSAQSLTICFVMLTVLTKGSTINMLDHLALLCYRVVVFLKRTTQWLL